MLPKSLQNRKDRLQKALASLSGGVEIVTTDERLREKSPAIRLIGNARIQKAKLRLSVWEEFRDIEVKPLLHAYSYHVMDEKDLEANSPIIRFECHPDLDPNPELNSANPYAIQPHFHPDQGSRAPFDELHYPFHRAERHYTIFALVEWLKVDLVKRFY